LKTTIPQTTRTLGIATVAALGLSMSACTYDAADLRDYVAEVKSRPGGDIEDFPRPEGAELIPEISQSSDPFKSFLVDELNNTAAPVDPDVPPWPPRNLEELERYALDSLRMVGTLDQQSEQWGLIKGPDGVIHRVKAGNFMGKNYGKVLEVTERRIHLLERVSDGRGEWLDRDAEISLSE
jgi:type IV pilus assembly protein PilP